MERLAAGLAAAAMLGASALAGCGSGGKPRPVGIPTPSASPGSIAASTSPTTRATPGTPSSPATSRAPESGPEKGFERALFSGSTTVDNKWLPLKPGTQFIYEGHTIEDGEAIDHRVVFTITDLTKVVAGVRNLVVWDRDYRSGQLEETELAFFAQADDGTIWHFGQYPEVYEDGTLVDAPAWVHGILGARAGITIKPDSRLGDPSYSQGWGPAVGWNDRARLYRTGQKTCVRAGCYDGVLVTAEFSTDEPGAYQLKYYAPGVGVVRVGYLGNDPTKETLELVKVVRLGPTALAEVRKAVMALERNAYRNSKKVYIHTAPMEQP